MNQRANTSAHFLTQVNTRNEKKKITIKKRTTDYFKDREKKRDLENREDEESEIKKKYI